MNFDYKLSNQVLNRVDQVRDLGVILDSKLNFKAHLEHTIKKALRSLGIILRQGKPFKCRSTYKLLFNSYVRSRLEFGCVVWSPHYQVDIDRVESVQKKFVKTLAYRTGHWQVDYADTCRKLHVFRLDVRRTLIDLVFLHKILNNKINSPSLLEQIIFKVPSRSLRKRTLFDVKSCHSNYVKNSSVRRVCSEYNALAGDADIDVFCDRLASYKNKIVKLLAE